ncbi:MAG TPA: bifunctional riboflavin kinase/FAD synthetase, partial [Candidatus Binatia bacterium]
MEILRHIGEQKLSLPRPILTMGNFDGIHLGHHALIRRLVQDAKDVAGCSVVLTFEPHPLKLLAPDRAPRLILAHKDKMLLLRSLGIDVVVIQEFNAAFAALEPRDFVLGYLVEGLGVHRIWVGKEFRFGRGRKGDVDALARWGTEFGFEVKIMEPVLDENQRISSTRIRSLIEQGEVHRVSRYLGRCHFVSGRVVRGEQRGRELGFPTANIATRTEVLPPDGVYATFLWLQGRRWPGVSSLGLNPTFGEGPRTLETFLFDFRENLYDKPVRLSFVQRIREQRKFSSPELLIAQMQQDVERA